MDLDSDNLINELLDDLSPCSASAVDSKENSVNAGPSDLDHPIEEEPVEASKKKVAPKRVGLAGRFSWKTFLDS